ncbi:MAG: ribbon-helix-helix protein, CopG family [Endozoicomonadaceae bacterium]|nr:ribbon-helix-helix protein, CopG family [Endozoicomonadaceae bacterium]
MAVITLNASQKFIDQVNALAKEEGVNKSELLRKAVECYKLQQNKRQLQARFSREAASVAKMNRNVEKPLQ